MESKKFQIPSVFPAGRCGLCYGVGSGKFQRKPKSKQARREMPKSCSKGSSSKWQKRTDAARMGQPKARIKQRKALKQTGAYTWQRILHTKKQRLSPGKLTKYARAAKAKEKRFKERVSNGK